MLRLASTLFLVLFLVNVRGADEIYNFKNIPKKLLDGANAVKRMDHTEFTIINTRTTKLRRHYAITILNEKGEEHAALEVLYDKLNTLQSIKGTLYDARGVVLKQLKNKDIRDISAVDDNNLAEDSRMKSHDFYYRDYPYTIEYEIVGTKNHTFIFPPWVPQQGEHFSVQQSDYTLTFPEDYAVRYKAFNYAGNPAETKEKGKIIRKWETRLVPAIEVPFGISSWADLATVVYFAPSDFEIAGYKGNLSTWDGFGAFQQSLNKDRDILPDAIALKVKTMTAGKTDVKEKVKILYQYLQQNTRYISVQLGIGGWQPFEAAYVAKNGYGDCKALTNYMHSLLKSAGIPSYYTVVYAGSSGFAQNRFVADLPSNQFNHVVLCVPAEKDSIWLECTSQQSPAGYMGNFTGNRKAVLVNEKGASVVSTPQYGLNENKQIRNIQAKLTDDGTLNMQARTVYTCLQQDGLSDMISALPEQKIREYLEKSLSLATYEIKTFKYNETKSALPSVSEDLEITVPNFANITGKRIFLVPNLLNRSGSQLTIDSVRKVDFVFDYAYHDTDSIEFTIPEGYELEAGLTDTSLQTPFGKYAVSLKLAGNKIVYTRLHEQYAGRFPASIQKEVIQFFQDVYRLDRSRVVLVKKD